jgi:CheY-like chemotaxis protein
VPCSQNEWRLLGAGAQRVNGAKSSRAGAENFLVPHRRLEQSREGGGGGATGYAGQIAGSIWCGAACSVLSERLTDVQRVRVKAMKTAPSPKTDLHVLVVDDEMLIRWAASEVLTADGCEVAEADNAAAAVRAVSGPRPPDVVLLDYRLPDCADLGLLATLRSLAPRAAIILMTAFGTPEVFAGAARLGAWRILHKPFEITELPHLVQAAYASAAGH